MEEKNLNGLFEKFKIAVSKLKFELLQADMHQTELFRNNVYDFIQY